MGSPQEGICCKDAPGFDPATGTMTPSSSNSGGTGGLVPCDTNCTLCHLVIGFKNIYEFFLKLLFVATMLAITVSGVFYMVSAGSKTLTEMAKKALTYSLTAFVIGMAGWILINTVMTALGYKHPYGGSWWQFTCDTSKASPAGGGAGSSNPNWSGGQQNTGTGDGTCGGTKDYVEDKGNCGKTSKQLDDVLACIKKSQVAFNYEKKNRNPFVETTFAAGKFSIGLGVDNPGHITNSCHYGGRNCQGQGNAADLTGSNLEEIQNAAIACGADSVIHNGMAYYGGNSKPYTGSNPHTGHVHISSNNCACGCDYLRC